MRSIKFKAFINGEWKFWGPSSPSAYFWEHISKHEIECWQYTGIKDKSDIEIYEGDVIQFTNKLEWYRFPLITGAEVYQILNDHEKYPYERRVVSMPECYEWLLSGEVQQYWEVIGNTHENPELISD